MPKPLYPFTRCDEPVSNEVGWQLIGIVTDHLWFTECCWGRYQGNPNNTIYLQVRIGPEAVKAGSQAPIDNACLEDLEKALQAVLDEHETPEQPLGVDMPIESESHPILGRIVHLNRP